MEESITLLTKIKEAFACEGQDVRAYSPLTLAYIGDGIYELVIRSVVVERANRSANDLHKKTTRYVKAPAQSAMIEALLPELTEEEEAVYRRGRNAKSYTTAKNASVADYRRATGFEALMGYLYLTGQIDRIFTNVERFSDSLSQSRIPTLVAQMNGTLAELNRTLAKVNDGDGTVGKFVNDQALYDSLVQASSNLSALLLDLKQHPGRYVHFSVFGRRDRN